MVANYKPYHHLDQGEPSYWLNRALWYERQARNLVAQVNALEAEAMPTEIAVSDIQENDLVRVVLDYEGVHSTNTIRVSRVDLPPSTDNTYTAYLRTADGNRTVYVYKDAEVYLIKRQEFSKQVHKIAEVVGCSLVKAQEYFDTGVRIQ